MATVTTTLTPDPRLFLYEGMPDAARQSSVAPVGEVEFIVHDESIASVGAGDNQAIDITCECPVNYAYALLDLSASISGVPTGNTNNWSTALTAFVSDSGFADRTFEWYLCMDNHGVSTNATNKQFRAYCPQRLPSIVVAGIQPQLQIQSFNTTAADSGYNLNLYARFLQFNVNQQHHFEVNTPIPTR